MPEQVGMLISYFRHGRKYFGLPSTPDHSDEVTPAHPVVTKAYS